MEDRRYPHVYFLGAQCSFYVVRVVNHADTEGTCQLQGSEVSTHYSIIQSFITARCSSLFCPSNSFRNFTNTGVNMEFLHEGDQLHYKVPGSGENISWRKRILEKKGQKKLGKKRQNKSFLYKLDLARGIDSCGDKDADSLSYEQDADRVSNKLTEGCPYRAQQVTNLLLAGFT